MYKLLRIALFALPLAGGAAWAQGSGTSGSAGAPGTITPPVTDDTRTPLQQKAGRIDDTTPAMPGDATKPADIPNPVKQSDRAGMPESTDINTPSGQPTGKKGQKQEPIKRDESTLERKSDTTNDTTKMDNKLDSDMRKDQLNSDK
ncbi:MAG: hypothetical protein ACXVDD_04450 [Polyangia bacterium]